MKTSAFLKRLESLEVRVWNDAGRLRCSAPKGVLTPELRAELGEHKDELLALLPGTNGSEATRPAPALSAPIRPVPRDGELPLSFTQQRLWFLQQLEPDMVAYNVPMAWTLEGDLDVPALERALDEILRRHEVLRTSFPQVGGRPSQRVHPAERLSLPVLENERGLPREERREEVRRWMLATLQEPFDLARPPLFRPFLLRVAEREHVLFVSVHHIVFDGLSIGIFLRELIELYEAFAAGGPSPLAPVQVQFADFAAWQREALAGEELERLLGFWRRTLGGELPLLELPTDRPRPPVQTFRGTHEERQLPRDLVEPLEALAKREGVTLYMVLLAAYQALLARLTGLEDVVVGSAINNRSRAEVEDTIGYFANTLVLRTDLGADPSFTELLRRVRDTCLEAFEHKDIPFERLVDELSPERSLAYPPIFQTLFLVEEIPDAAKRMGDVAIHPIQMDCGRAQIDLTLWVCLDPDRFYAWAEYNTDLFDGDRIARLLASYEEMLRAIAEDASRAVSELPLLPEEERRKVVEEWNATSAPFPEEPVFAQFEAQVDRTPEATALVFPALEEGGEDEAYTYAELDAAANRLARWLVARGVEPNSLVGLCLERSAEMVIAQLAIQKAGAAYVPLDPSYPADRLAYMVEDAELALVVTASALVPFLPESVEPVLVDEDAEAIASQDASRLELAVPVTSRMYVIYTSGSTGRPKGVELEHRSVSNFLASMAKEPGMTSADSLLAVTTLSFDISVLETMLPLVTGATVVVAPREATGDGAQLIALLDRLRPSVMQATPATWRLLLVSGWKGDAGLKVLCGGEALPRELADELLPRVGELWNVYGPTETTIWSTVDRVREDGPIAIGRPLANTQVYVLDAAGEPQPIGVPGELWIAGDGLARGYLKRPELTDERFRPDPFAEREGARMYRTGDLACWRADGRLECLGRIDNQVKLRGFRIELGEIESVLADDPSVQQVVCVVREDTPGDQRLTAYVVTADGAELDAEALRDAAREKLPVYMVPSSFVELDALPHTPNGKVDRNALLARDAEGTTVAPSEIVAPRTDLERKIASIWSEVLKLDAVSVTVNFFDLGGHSLLLAQVHAKLVEALGRKLSIIELFQYPTVAQLATHLEDEGAVAGEREARGRGLAEGRRALAQRRRARR